MLGGQARADPIEVTERVPVNEYVFWEITYPVTFASKHSADDPNGPLTKSPSEPLNEELVPFTDTSS
jgi:hypothetical protein